MDSSVSPRILKQYDVFLSFRGSDTRRGIVSHLHRAFLDRRIDDIFKDDKTIEMGESISEEIKEAIHGSKFAVIVISANYVSSTWCLNELQMIMELHKKKQLVAIPIFYDVEPSDVRDQRGTFSLERYESSRLMLFFSSTKRTMAAKIHKWREALNEVGGTSGKESKTCEDEATMVEDIVGHIARELFSLHPIDLSDIVGMDAHMEEISSQLDMDSTDEVRMIGIWGMGGIGKTTIAKCLYKEYSPQFAPHYCFIENVNISAQEGLPQLQEKLLSSILGKKQETFWGIEQGCSLIKSKLKKLRVFIVLDGVDSVNQLRALARETSWFGPGSRIIITTRDLGFLYSCASTYHVSLLGIDDAMQVFKQVAFEGGHAPSDAYEQLSFRASRLAQGLPSALEAFGTYLRRMTSLKGWEKALGILEKVPHQSIMDILRTSYDSLDKRDQAVFLHLACLFNGDYVQRVNALIEDGDIRIKGLEKKSLIDISPDGCITMHVLVEQGAREIVCQESRSIPWRQRIMWEPEQIVYVLQNNTGPTTTEGMKLHMCELLSMVSIDGNVLNTINNLKFLKAYTHLDDTSSKLQFLPGTDKLPKTLKLLHWDSYPMNTLPHEYYPNCLVELNLRNSNLVRLWDGILGLSQLRRLDVTGSKNLTVIPNLARATLLEELIAKGCTRLTKIPESICSLSYLRKLDFSQCDGLTNLQIHLSEKTVLPERGLRRRRQMILKLPGAIKKITSLANLSIEGKIHIGLWHLKGKAEHLTFISEQQIPDELMVMPKERFPFISSFYDFKSLSIKRFSYTEDGGVPFVCSSFSGFPCLAELNLINLNISKIPEDIGLLQSLEKLDLSENDIKNLPASTKNLSSKLKYLNLSNCNKLEVLPKLTDLQTLNISGCNNLGSRLILSHTDQEIGLNSLLELEINNYRNVQSLSDQLSHYTNLLHLDLSRHNFELIPGSIRHLVSLGTLCLNNCKKLKTIEELPQSIKHLYAHGCDSLENVFFPPNHSIKHLDLSHCFNLQQNNHLITQFLNNEYSQEVSQRFICIPGATMPIHFENRSSGKSTKIRLPPIRSRSRVLGFAACIMISSERSVNLRFQAFSYDLSCEDDESIRISLKPNLNHESEIEEVEEKVTENHNHVVIISVPKSINADKIEELRLESRLQFQPHGGEIIACGIRMIHGD
ncbi:unnamed protein product [Cochlearia groenlandica]